MTGTFVIVEGDKEAKAWLRTAEPRIDDWLYEVSDSIVFHESDLLHETAPGRIKALVDYVPVVEERPHYFEGLAGVKPDGFALPGPGSAKEDYPFYVEEGTGLYGELHSIIYPLVGTLMGPIEDFGYEYWIKSSKGQPGQHYGRRAYEETVAWVPSRLEEAKASLFAKTEAVAKV